MIDCRSSSCSWGVKLMDGVLSHIATAQQPVAHSPRQRQTGDWATSPSNRWLGPPSLVVVWGGVSEVGDTSSCAVLSYFVILHMLQNECNSALRTLAVLIQSAWPGWEHGCKIKLN